ncbi:chromosome segregation protein SMC [Acutalibacter intestini]|uniref:chromosome segregation protein SMC n=1 Tax=Acutalibacter intestini TaxID=3093659 RepID=UPI002AC95D1E|nr:chromosome segregation protein SMC [Acutalibacter sp. M00204]
MILKSLELQGFKTFPDKTTLSFEPGITSVVGPNGSGKSNISDAMRWVMGEQSLRTLRCSKMEDVVFGGTPQRKALGFAEVTLTIDNSDRRLPFDNDQVAITRRYYRSGESEYLINKSTVRLRDINELFMDTGLGRDGYSIIGQGKIDSIVAARSEDRREIFEEAAGISRYRYRKEEAQRRLTKAEENLVRLRDILSELEGRVGPLKEQAEKAEKFIQYDAEKKELEIGIWLETLERSGRTLREHEEKLGVMRAQHQEIEEEIEGVNRRTEENYRETNQCTASMELARNQAAALDEQALRAEGEIGLLNSEISHNRQDVERLKGQIQAAQQSHQDTQQEMERKTQELAAQEARINQSRQKLVDYTARLEELRQGADQSTREIEQAAVELAGINASLSEERVRMTSAQSSMGEIRLRAQAVEESLCQAEQREAAAREEGRELSQMLEEAGAAIVAKENEVSGHQLRLMSRKKRAQAAREQLDKLTLDANEQLRRARLLEDLERNLEGFAQSVKAVMKEAQRGMLKGVCGPVTRLLKPPPEYAVALETALGAAMQNIVVETEQDAKSAISLLKQRDLGRATFLPLTTIKGHVLDPREMENMPGFVGVAARLCQCEEKYGGIRDSLLGRVAVAEDLDSAVSIAKRTGYRFRVVSLDGQVVNAGGSLTGGSRAKNSGLLSRAGEIQRIKEKAAALRAQAEQANQTYKASQGEVSACEAQLNAAQGELYACQEERAKISAELTQAQRELDAILESAQTLRAEREGTNARLETLSVQEAASREQLDKLEEAARVWEEKSQSLSGSREIQMARCNEIGDTIQALRMEEFSAQKDRDTLAAGLEELKARQQDAAGLQSRLAAEIDGLEEKSGQLAEEIRGLTARVDDLRAQAQAQRQSVEEAAQHRAELEKESAQLRTQEREAVSRRESAGRELARLQERSDNLQKEYDGIITRLWEEYELTRREAEEQGKPIEDLPTAQRRLQELKNKIKALGAVNVGAVVEYQEVAERYNFLNTQVTDAETAKKELLDLIGDLTGAMREQFTQRFGEINENFGRIFRELFGGGAAELSFSDPADVLTSGIDIKVHPPGKIVTHIESLSGGEKALVAISIYFAIMRVNPPPFCVLDEIEAALDDVNVARFAQYLRRMTSQSQFITITHRRGTMEGSDMLYGVTMQDQGVSKLLALKTDEAAEFSA